MAEKTVEKFVSPFAVEADHPRNSDLLLQAVVNLRLRSAFDGMKPAIDKHGDAKVPLSQAAVFAPFPRYPGDRIYVNPSELVYRVVDPTYEDEALCDRITKALKSIMPVGSGSRYVGRKPIEGKIDKHQMKTLCRELYQIVYINNEAKQIKGPPLLMDEIDLLPGDYLLNPGMRTQTSQPRFEKDFEAWKERLSFVTG